MAYSHHQQRSSRRGHGVGRSAPSQEYHMTYMQGPLEGFDASESFVGRFTEEPSVDPRNLILDQVTPGGNGLNQDFGNLADNQFQPDVDASVHPGTIFTDSPVDFSYSDLSNGVSGERA